jgi:two-component system phosphate regulon sensor histidine kinase PhoR
MLASVTVQKGGGGTVVVLHDVTELRRLETIRQDFVANVSHELRTPVSVIRANTETLLNGALEEPQRARDFLEALQRNSERLSNLIADLLDISRIDSGQYQMDIQKVSIAAVVRQTLEALELPAKRKKLKVEKVVDEKLQALADEKALHQVVLNLVDNAVKYTSEGGNVKIQAAGHDDRLRIEVADDGPGIEPRHRDRVFERFYRIDAGRSREMGGTGLGLSITKNLVETMGGQIGVEPNHPNGTIFWFSLPKG